MREYDENLTWYAALRSKESDSGEREVEVICHDWLTESEVEEFAADLNEEPGWNYSFMAISDKTLATMEEYDVTGNLDLFSKSTKRP